MKQVYEIHKCHDCNVFEGQVHEFGCDIERCPICGKQLICCDCIYEYFGYTIDPYHPTSGLPAEIYENGLSAAKEREWIRHLESTVGRIPYIVYPNVCARCGELWPDMFKVPDEEWKKYVAPGERGKILCQQCYDEIKLLIDTKGFTQSPEDK